MCFFCPVESEHSIRFFPKERCTLAYYLRTVHRLVSCPMVRMVWRYIKLLWMSLIRVSLSSFNWVFAHMENNEPMPHFKFIFEFLRYCWLWFNWNMWNAITFGPQVVVRKCVLKLKDYFCDN